MGYILKWAAEEVKHGKNIVGGKMMQKHVFMIDFRWITSILGRFKVWKFLSIFHDFSCTSKSSGTREIKGEGGAIFGGEDAF